jgi:hypothetical protein
MSGDQVKELLAKVMELAGKQEMEVEDVSKVNDNITDLATIIEKVELAAENGLQWEDITVIGHIVPNIMKLAAGFGDYEGLDKRRFVIEVVWLIYRIVDTFPDGKQNNINVPWLAGSFERKLERAVVAFAAGMAVDAVYDRMKKGGEV